MEDVVIHVSAAESHKLMDVVGDLASEQYENGLNKTRRLGGFKIRVNDLLPRVAGAPKVIISTNFAYKSFHTIINVASGKINPLKKDIGAAYSDAIAQGIVYTGVTKVLY